MTPSSAWLDHVPTLRRLAPGCAHGGNTIATTQAQPAADFDRKKP